MSASLVGNAAATVGHPRNPQGYDPSRPAIVGQTLFTQEAVNCPGSNFLRTIVAKPFVAAAIRRAARRWQLDESPQLANAAHVAPQPNTPEYIAEQTHRLKEFLEHTPRAQIFEALRLVLQRPTLRENDVLDFFEIQWHANGLNKNVLKAIFHLKSGELVPLAVKVPRHPEGISLAEITDVQRLFGQYVPQFGVELAPWPDGPAYIEGFIDGSTAGQLARENRLPATATQSITYALLTVTRALGGWTPRDFHAENFIFRRADGQVVMVEVGNHRIPFSPASADDFSRLLVVAGIVAHYGISDGRMTVEPVFAGIIEALGVQEGTALLRRLSEVSNALGRRHLARFLDRNGQSIFWILQKRSQPIPIKLFASQFIDALQIYVRGIGPLEATEAEQRREDAARSAEALRNKAYADAWNAFVEKTLAANDPESLLRLAFELPADHTRGLMRLQSMLRHFPDARPSNYLHPDAPKNKFDLMIDLYENSGDSIFRENPLVITEYLYALNRSGRFEKVDAVAQPLLARLTRERALDPDNQILRTAHAETLMAFGTARINQYWAGDAAHRDKQLLWNALYFYQRAFDANYDYYAAMNVVRTFIFLGQTEAAKEYSFLAIRTARSANWGTSFWVCATLLEQELLKDRKPVDGDLPWLQETLDKADDPAEVQLFLRFLNRWSSTLQQNDPLRSTLAKVALRFAPKLVVVKSSMPSASPAKSATSVEAFIAKNTFDISGIRRGNGFANGGVIADTVTNLADREAVRRLIENRGWKRLTRIEDLERNVEKYVEEFYELGAERPRGLPSEISDPKRWEAEGEALQRFGLERRDSLLHQQIFDWPNEALRQWSGLYGINGEPRISATNVTALMARAPADCRPAGFAKAFLMGEVLRYQLEDILRAAVQEFPSSERIQNADPQRPRHTELYSRYTRVLRRFATTRYQVVVFQSKVQAEVQTDAHGVRTVTSGIQQGRPIKGVPGTLATIEPHTLPVLLEIQDRLEGVMISRLWAIDAWYRVLYKLGFTEGFVDPLRNVIRFPNAFLASVDDVGSRLQRMDLSLAPASYAGPRMRVLLNVAADGIVFHGLPSDVRFDELQTTKNSLAAKRRWLQSLSHWMFLRLTQKDLDDKFPGLHTNPYAPTTNRRLMPQHDSRPVSVSA